MRLTVEIVRHEDGTLRAYVVQGKFRGDNVLTGRMLTNVHSARIAVSAELQVKYGPIEFEWIGEQPDSDNKRVTDKAVATKRDGYGMRSA